MRLRIISLISSILLLAVAGVAAQTIPKSAENSTPAATALPEPYSKNEFPAWANAVRRFEIIALGSLPIMLFYTNVGFDLTRYFQNGFASQYAPWPFKNESSYKPTEDEQIRALKTAAVFSLSLAVADAAIQYLGDPERK